MTTAYAKCVSVESNRKSRANGSIEKPSDPRYKRVNAALTKAILEVSSSIPAEQVSIAELTKIAGVHRTSFYSHASSPTELLVDALTSDINSRVEAFEATLFNSASPRNPQPVEFWMGFYRIVLEAVVSNRSVWTTMVRNNSAALVGVQRHLEAYARRVFPTVMRGWLGSPGSDLRVELACQQVALNAVALVTAWVDTGMLASINQVMEDYRAVAPPWQLARRSAAGDITLEKRRRH